VKRRWPLAAAAVALAMAVIVGLWVTSDDDGGDPESAASTSQPSATDETLTTTTVPPATGSTEVSTTTTPQDPTTAPQSTEPASTQPLPTTVQTAIPRQSIGPGGGPPSATGLMARSDCDPEVGAYGQLSWAPAAEAGSEQRVAITQFADGFTTGRFTVSEPLAGDAAQLLWERLEPGVLYRWQVLTQHGDVYAGSETAMFRGADCFADS